MRRPDLDQPFAKARDRFHVQRLLEANHTIYIRSKTRSSEIRFTYFNYRFTYCNHRDCQAVSSPARIVTCAASFVQSQTRETQDPRYATG